MPFALAHNGCLMHTRMPPGPASLWSKDGCLVRLNAKSTKLHKLDDKHYITTHKLSSAACMAWRLHPFFCTLHSALRRPPACLLVCLVCLLYQQRAAFSMLPASKA